MKTKTKVLTTAALLGIGLLVFDEAIRVPKIKIETSNDCIVVTGNKRTQTYKYDNIDNIGSKYISSVNLRLDAVETQETRKVRIGNALKDGEYKTEIRLADKPYPDGMCPMEEVQSNGMYVYTCIQVLRNSKEGIKLQAQFDKFLRKAKISK